MKILYSWLKDFIDISLPPEELATALTRLGIEVASMEKTGAQFTGVFTAKILNIARHPNADKLSLVDVDYGHGKTTVVCGAKNIAAGQTVPLALVGAKLPDGVLKKSKIRGVESEGMICSSAELHVPGGPEDGIFVFPENTAVGLDASKMFGEPDCVFELEITPNRADLLSHLGVARELATLYSLPVKMPAVKELAGKGPALPVKIHDEDACPRYTGRIIRNIKAAQSPQWMKTRLEAMGSKPRNTLIDITNYILHELGQPLHAFDLDLISGGEINVRRASAGEKIRTLEGAEAVLSPEILVIADRDKPAAIAGVMGGEATAVSDTTTNVFLESAYFSQKNINRASKKLGIKSESSNRYERGTDPEMTVFASNRATELFMTLSGTDRTEISELGDTYPKPSPRKTISVTPEAVNLLLGIEVPEQKISAILKQLDPKLDTSSMPWKLTVPTYRHDMESKWDIADEVARLHGYDSMPDTPRPATIAYSPRSPEQELAEKFRDILCGLGFCEIQTYDFISAKDCLRFGFDPQKTPVLANPLSSDWEYMRPSLLPGLVSTLAYNERHGADAVQLFESGKTYSINNGNPQETLHCAGVLCGNIPQEIFWRGGDSRPLDIHYLAGIIQSLCRDVSGFRLMPAAQVPSYAHPKLCMDILCAGKRAGTLAKMHPSAASACGVKNQHVWLFELSVAQAAKSYSPAEDTAVKAVSQFPTSWRDLSILVPSDAQCADITSSIRKSGALITSVELADLYEGKGVPEGKKSMTYRLTFSLPDRTLKDEEVNAAFDKALAAVTEKFAAALRS